MREDGDRKSEGNHQKWTTEREERDNGREKKAKNVRKKLEGNTSKERYRTRNLELEAIEREPSKERKPPTKECYQKE